LASVFGKALPETQQPVQAQAIAIPAEPFPTGPETTAMIAAITPIYDQWASQTLAQRRASVQGLLNALGQYKQAAASNQILELADPTSITQLESAETQPVNFLQMEALELELLEVTSPGIPFAQKPINEVLIAKFLAVLVGLSKTELEELMKIFVAEFGTLFNSLADAIKRKAWEEVKAIIKAIINLLKGSVGKKIIGKFGKEFFEKLMKAIGKKLLGVIGLLILAYELGAALNAQKD
jgi:hypothetical protein